MTLSVLETLRVPMPPEVTLAERDDDEVADTNADLLVAPRADVLLLSLERLDPLSFGGPARERVLDEVARTAPRRRPLASSGR